MIIVDVLSALVFAYCLYTTVNLVEFWALKIEVPDRAPVFFAVSWAYIAAYLGLFSGSAF